MSPRKQIESTLSRYASGKKPQVTFSVMFSSSPTTCLSTSACKPVNISSKVSPTAMSSRSMIFSTLRSWSFTNAANSVKVHGFALTTIVPSGLRQSLVQAPPASIMSFGSHHRVGSAGSSKRSQRYAAPNTCRFTSMYAFPASHAVFAAEMVVGHVACFAHVVCGTMGPKCDNKVTKLSMPGIVPVRPPKSPCTTMSGQMAEVAKPTVTPTSRVSAAKPDKTLLRCIASASAMMSPRISFKRNNPRNARTPSLLLKFMPAVVAVLVIFENCSSIGALTDPINFSRK
mmetsp:Transcript_128295/g.371404  ORF Transcript_128295/g.371404 Transcript_128295/m.371404 type:complete len:286 (+) Transcript_128295:307-1164(+)